MVAAISGSQSGIGLHHPSRRGTGMRPTPAPPAAEPCAQRAGEDQGEAGPGRPGREWRRGGRLQWPRRGFPHSALGHRGEGIGLGCRWRRGRGAWRPRHSAGWCDRRLAGRAEERQRIHVVRPRPFAADADMQARVPARAGRRGAQPRPAGHAGAAMDCERAEWQIRDAPGATAHADGRPVGAGHAGEDHPPGAGRAHRRAGAGSEVSAAVAARRERVAPVVERACHRTGQRPLPAARRRCGRRRRERDRDTPEQDRAGEPGEGPGPGHSPPPARPARSEASRGAERGHGVDARELPPGSGPASRKWYEEVARLSRSPGGPERSGRPAVQ